jgi:hypothetical protein
LILRTLFALFHSYFKLWRGGRVAEGGGLLNRYRVEKLYRGFESPLLRTTRPKERTSVSNVRDAFFV